MFRINPITPQFAARIEGCDLCVPLPDRDIVAIIEALDRYAVVVFPNQNLSEDAQVAFTAQLGEVLINGNRARSVTGKQIDTARTRRELIEFSNLNAAGEVADRADPRVLYQLVNRMWHTDSSFEKPPARYSLLFALEIPPRGGNTEFADLRQAYDRLDDDTKFELEGLMVEHFAFHSRAMLGISGWTEDEREKLPPVTWPLVRTHPGSKRKLLYVSAHASHIEGMTVPEGRALLNDLMEHATAASNIYAHRWTAGDFLIWDNRAVVHRGRRYDLAQRREIRRSMTADINFEDKLHQEQAVLF